MNQNISNMDQTSKSKNEITVVIQEIVNISLTNKEWKDESNLKYAELSRT